MVFYGQVGDDSEGRWLPFAFFQKEGNPLRNVPVLPVDLW